MTNGIHPAPQEFNEEEIRQDHILQFFHYAHLPVALRTRSQPFCELAREIGCQECGKPVSGLRSSAQFCCAPCRMAFNNRRRDRGSEMYDLFRALRRERDTAKNMKIWTAMTQLELRWQEEDERDRPGRRSYIKPQRAIANLQDRGLLPRGDLLVRSYLNARKPDGRSARQHRQG